MTNKRTAVRLRQACRSCLLCFGLLAPVLVCGQVYKVTLTAIQACGGATIVPFVQYNAPKPAPVTVYYERLVAADTWQLESSQVYHSNASFVMYNGNDLLSATIFRVRAIDGSSGTTFLSNSVSVDPARWNTDRGQASASAFGYWGTGCGPTGYIALNIFSNTGGRPPFTVEYKKSTDASYMTAGQFTGGLIIPNTDPTFNYSIRITDQCGKVINTGTSMQMRAAYDIVQQPEGCAGGKVTLSASQDTRYSGVAPFTYALGRYRPATGVIDTVFTTQTLYENLPDGLYFGYVKDACGNISSAASIPLGKSFPQTTMDFAPVTDPCYKNVYITPVRGKGPFRFGLKHAADPDFTYQSDSTFIVTRTGSYQYHIISACGDTSATGQGFVEAGCPLRTAEGDFTSGTSPQGCPDFSGTQWMHIKDNQGNIIFSVNPNGNSIPDVCWGVRIVSGNGSLRTQTISNTPVYFLDRNFYIEPPTGTTLTDSLSVRLYATATEINNLLTYMSAATGSPKTIDDIRILKKTGSSTSPVDLDVTNDGVASNSQFTIIKPNIQPYNANWYLEFKIGSFSELNPAIGNLEPALPLRLISFRAKAESEGVQLSWVTAEEVNTNRFEVFWGTKVDQLRQVGSVIAHPGMSSETYSFTHSDPQPGLNYYRLKMIDEDETFTWSKVISARVRLFDKLTIAPNPVHDIVRVEIGKKHGYTLLKIYNMLGMEVLRKSFIPDSAIEIDVRKLAAGMYLVQLEGNERNSITFLKF